MRTGEQVHAPQTRKTNKNETNKNTHRHGIARHGMVLEIGS